MTVEVNGKKIGRKSKVQLEREESHKLKKVALKDISSGSAIQLCLEAVNVPDILEMLQGTGAVIESCMMAYRFRESKVKIEAPKKLSEYGAVYHRKGGGEESIEISLTHASIHEVAQSIKAVSEHYGRSPKEFVFRKLRLNKDNAVVVFKHVLKDLPMDHDKRKKVRVLALIKINRDKELAYKAEQLLSKFSLAKYICKFHTEEKKVAICAKV